MKYNSLSNFLRNATEEEKADVFSNIASDASKRQRIKTWLIMAAALLLFWWSIHDVLVRQFG